MTCCLIYLVMSQACQLVVVQSHQDYTAHPNSILPRYPLHLGCTDLSLYSSLHTDKVYILGNYIFQARWLPLWCFTPTQHSLGWNDSLFAWIGLRYMSRRTSTLPSLFHPPFWILFLIPRESTGNTLSSIFISLKLTGGLTKPGRREVQQEK